MLYFISMSLLPKNQKLIGQSIIGILIAIAIFALLANAIFTLVTSSYRLIGFTRARITARHLAQNRIEFIRNLPYDSVGTQGGIPSGPLEQNESTRVNGMNFNIKTSILYIDDSFDLEAPDDLLPTDYKRIRVEVSWDGVLSSNRNPVVIVTDISPKGVETTVGGGTLSILVFDANGEPVPQADVSITTSSIPTQIDLELQTQDNGRIILPGAPACINCYEIVVSKDGYSTDRTYSTSEVTNPTRPHSTVIEGDLTEISFAIDRLSNVTILTTSGREEGFGVLPNATLLMRGSKTIGTDSSGNSLHKYDQTITTDQNGEVELELEWDTYNIIPAQPSIFDISGTNPFLPYSLNPDKDVTVLVSLVGHSENSLLTFFTPDGETPIASVSATLSKADYEETKFSGSEDDPDFGQVFFSGLEADVYQMTATASGYQNFDGEFIVNGNKSEKTVLISE